MRTLVAVDLKEWDVHGADVSSDNPAVCHVTDDGSMLVIAQNNEGAMRLGRIMDQTGEYVTLGELPEQSVGHCVRLVDLGDGSAAAAFAEGTVARMEYSAGEMDWEEVGAVSDGLVEMALSPDGEVFVLITAKGKAVLMNREFDPLSEVEVHQEGFGQGEFVNVGWGKKETQFHGSLGKQAALAKPDTVSGAKVRSDMDDGSVRVTWREDGELFAVSYMPPLADQGRTIRVFSRDGILQSTSETTIGLEHSLAFKPSGAIMATTVRAPNKYEVAFFEKNGLRHGGFDLRLDRRECVVTNLLWSKAGDALLVASKSVETLSCAIHIYTCSNYHWSLAQAWDGLPVFRHLQWDPTLDLR